MAITFGEIKHYLARNVRLSICFEDGHYHNYVMVSDIPDQKYDRLYVYGIGMIDVEITRDVYSMPQEPNGVMSVSKDDILGPAIEIVLHKEPREIERSTEDNLMFRDLKPYLQIGRYFSVVNREDWSYETYTYRNDIPEKYDELYVYGIGMEDHTDIYDPTIEREKMKDPGFDSYLKKRMVLVLSEEPRKEEIRRSREWDTFIVIRDDLSEEERAFVENEIKSWQEKYEIHKKGITYFNNSERLGESLSAGFSFYQKIKRMYSDYLKFISYNSYLENDIHVYEEDIVRLEDTNNEP